MRASSAPSSMTITAWSVEVLAGVFAGDVVTWSDYGRFLVVAVIGNAIGGTVFVALIKYGHAINAEEQ